MSPQLPLQNRTVLITGGNGGIGLGMASAVGAAGAKVVIWGRNIDKNQAAVDQLTAQGVTAHAFTVDVSDPLAIGPAFDASIEAAGGKIDSVFANAGLGDGGGNFLEITLEQWRRVMATNLDGVFLTLQAAARHMTSTGGGALVAVSSISAIHGSGGDVAYGTSKTALLGMVRALAVGLARHKIRVNSLLPGWTITDLSSGGYSSEKFRTAITTRTPARRWAEPEEMGPAAVFLADPTTTFHTGDTIVIDGGYTIF